MLNQTTKVDTDGKKLTIYNAYKKQSSKNNWRLL